MEKKQKQNKPVFRVLGDRVILQPDELPDMTASGLLHIPDTAYSHKEPWHIGTIVAVGEGRWSEDGTKLIPIAVKPGDRVLFPLLNGSPVPGADRKDGERIVDAIDIAAVVSE